VVLRIQWLQTLGTHYANHQKQFISFKWKGQKHRLYGFQALEDQVVSSSLMTKMIQTGAPTSTVQCHQLEMLSSKGSHEESPEEQGLVRTHEKVFQDLPIKVPPNRKIKHPIEVKTGSDPVDIRSFHYPDQQKIELENMLHDLFKMWEARARRS